jgi:STE24 endopeptidase
MSWITWLFVCALVISAGVRLWLDQRQIAAVRRHRESVPDAFSNDIDIEHHRKGADYTVANTLLAQIDVAIDLCTTLALTLGGGIALIDRLWQPAHLSLTWHGTAVILSTVLILGMIGLPLSIYRTFSVEARFGFNRSTPKIFILDLLKALALGVVIGTPLLWVILWLMARAGSLWWLYAWFVWTAFTLTLTWAYPAFIAPLFNKFNPLADDSLRHAIESLLQRCGFSSQGVFVMDGSKRSAHGNAYFTGVGRNKRIVFFDTLLERLSGQEIEAVLAHELGHFKLHHIRSRMLVSLLMGLIGLAVLGVLYQRPEFFHALGVASPSPYAALLLFMLAASPFTFFLTPLSARWSRRHEFEADEFARDKSNAENLAAALVKLYRDNATTLTPDALHSAFYDSHPPAPIRITRLRAQSS